LVNVHIHQFQPGGTVVDAAALAQFQEQWATYRKLVESDCLAHRAVSGLLRETLNDVFTSPFCFLDIARTSPAAFEVVSEKPSFFFTVPAKNPRTLCCCQSVACIISSMLAPLA
jgi:hypothetical protein